jgi:LacI family transcriptional regulator
MRSIPSIALLIESSNAYARGLLRGVSSYVREHEPWTVFLPEYERGHEPPGWFRRWKGDGIIARIENERIARAVKSLRIPVVDVSAAREVPEVPWVETDDAAIAKIAFDHLRERGFSRLAYCGDPQFNWSKWRCEQFLAAAGKEQIECHVYQTPQANGSALPWSREMQHLGKWLRELPKPIGIMACYDIKARQVLDACRSEGIAVPEQIAVIGVDDDELMCDLCQPRLSSIIPDSHRAGYVAAQLLNEMIAGSKLEPSAHLIPPLGVKIRQSSDIFAIEDKTVALALQFIRRHASEGITVADVAQAVSMSRKALDSRFLQVLETTLPLHAVADRAGFSYVEYLSVAFKRVVGVPPGEFRRSQAAGARS